MIHEFPLSNLANKVCNFSVAQGQKSRALCSVAVKNGSIQGRDIYEPLFDLVNISQVLTCSIFHFRRAHLRDCLTSLRDLVPTPPDQTKATTLSLLQSAKQYIKVRNIRLII